MTYQTYRIKMARLVRIARKISSRPVYNNDRLIKILKAAAELNSNFPDYATRSYDA